MSDRTLVTGGTGFIGSHLVERLRDGGTPVAVLTHERPPDGEVHVVEGDVTVLDTLPSFEGYDVVVHLAGIVSVRASLDRPEEAFAVNAEGTQNVLERSRVDGVDRVVYVSSAAVYGEPEYLPIDESHPTRPLHPYAATKLAGEELAEAYAHSYGLDVATIRSFTTYGPGQSSDNLIPELVGQLREGKEDLSLGNLAPTRDFVFVEDVVSAIMTLLDDPPRGYDRFNVGSEEEVSVREVVETILRVAGANVPISSTRSRDDEVEINRMVADCGRLRELGWRPEFTLREGLRATVEGVDV